jgi:hypothetical protein
MKNMAKMLFRAQAPPLPLNWSNPSGDPAGKHYIDAFTPSERASAPPPVPPGLFMPASINKYHCDTARTISDKMEAYIDGICDAICSAWNKWQSSATLVGVVINAVTAAGGQVVGPTWLPTILADAPMSTLQEAKYSMSIASAISLGWLAYQATIKVPGLPWYPAFATVPSPVAPPVPNVPCPVVALIQVPVPVMSMTLRGQMIAFLGDPTAQHSQVLFASIAGAFEACFILWQTTTQVTKVIGTGPVPTFAPPVVPVGPVVGGVGNMVPGGFS